MRLSFSPCPNDTFIFHAMLHGLVDTENLVFDLHIADVEELNYAAFSDLAEATKVSCVTYLRVANRYELLDAGSALGRGNGPLLVSRSAGAISKNSLVLMPGRHTTATFLLQIIFPQLRNLREMLFSDIPAALAQGYADAGVLIHESRFTYHEHGLHLLADLGHKWEQRTGLPVPLGCIAISHRVEPQQRQAFARVMRRSVDYAMQHPNASRAFVKRHAQELSDAVIDQHIAMFVNDYTRSLGSEGRRAIENLKSLKNLSTNGEALTEGNYTN
jgi:1,4-dihydroxy-6-naphthoate synthase